MGRLTDKQESFAAQVAKGASYSAAYRIAYPTSLTWGDRSVWVKSSELAKNVDVMLRVDQLKKPSIEAAQYGVEEAMRETDTYLLEAAKDRAWGPVGAMLKHKAQLNALLLNKVEVSVGEFGAWNAHKKLAAIDALQIEIDRRKALEAADVEDVADKLDAGEE